MTDRWDDDDADLPAEEYEDPTVPCPYCRRSVYEDAPRCPHCGQYISAEDAPAKRPPWWIILGVLAVLYVVYRWTVG